MIKIIIRLDMFVGLINFHVKKAKSLQWRIVTNNQTTKIKYKLHVSLPLRVRPKSILLN